MAINDTIETFAKNRLAVAGAVIVALFLFAAVFGPLLAPYDPLETDYDHVLEPPSAGHLMGTDHMGRDVFSRVLAGTRYAFYIGFGVVIIEGIIGVVLGVLAGYYGGVVDSVIMRVVDVLLSIPAMVLAIVIAGSYGGGLWTLILTMVIISWAHFARLMRGQALAEKQRLYIESTRALGAGDVRIIFRHILPNTVSVGLVFSTLEIPWAILFSSGLSFLGVGIKPPTPEWGSIIASGRDHLFSSWWISTYPGIVLMIVVLGFNFFGDGLRDLMDPRLKRRV